MHKTAFILAAIWQECILETMGFKGEPCYVCGEPATGRQHLPPDSYFPRPLSPRLQLITVPSCQKHNQGMSQLEEDFRAFLTGAFGANRAAKEIWRQKVTSPKARRSFKNLMGSVRTMMFGEAQVPVITFDEERGNEFLTTLTRGFISKFYPARWSPVLYFRVRIMNGPKGHSKARELFLDLAPGMTFVRKGDVFACYHREATAKAWYSFWIYNFFGCAQFFVMCTDRCAPEFLD